MKEKVKKLFKSDVLYWIIFAAVSVGLALLVFPFCSKNYINYDSTYQYGLTGKSFGKLLKLIPQDYSPPLYAVLLKLYSLVFGNTLFALRTFNLLVVVGMLALLMFPLRRLYGGKVAVASALIIAPSFMSQYFLQEIRPTVLATFFLLGTVIYAADVCFTGDKASYRKFTVFVILGMYTHNITMVGDIGIYAVLFGAAILGRNFVKVKKIFISGVISALVYSPWLLVILKQFANVRDHFWISHMNKREMVDCLIYKSLDGTNYGNNQLYKALFFLPVILIIYIIIKTLYEGIHAEDKNNLKILPIYKAMVKNYLSELKLQYKKLLFMLAACIFPMLINCFIHYNIHPLITDRYIYILAPVFFIFLSNLFVLFPLLPAGLTSVICMAGAIMTGVKNTEVLKKRIDASNMDKMISLLEEKKGSDLVFLHDHEATFCMMYYFPEAKHYMYKNTFSVLNDFTVLPSDVILLDDKKDIAKYEKEVYCFTDVLFRPTDDIYDGDYGFTSEELGVYRDPYSFRSEWQLVKVTSPEQND